MQLAIVTQGLAPGMWAVVSRVVSWEWIETSGRVRWVVESFLSPHVIRSAIPSVMSIEMVKPDDAREPAVLRRTVRKRALPAAVSAAS